MTLSSKRRPQICYKRGPKRQLGMHYADSGCSPSKQFISEEMMAARMKELSISPVSTVTPQHLPVNTVVMPSTGGTSDCRHIHAPRLASNWQIMKEIEERLEDEEDEEIASTLSSTGPTKPRLHMLTHDFSAKDLLSSNPLLPKKIIDDLIKPTMQVVLWKPPGDLIKNTVSQVVTSAEPDPGVLPPADELCDLLPKTESSSDIVSDDHDKPTAGLPHLQETESVLMPGLVAENSSIQAEEDMDL